MNIQDEIIKLADAELTQANEKFPQFHSAHEGYAVLLEEVEELNEELTKMSKDLDCVWEKVRSNAPRNHTMVFIGELYCNARRAAYEAIQVAAMAKKFMDMEKKI